MDETEECYDRQRLEKLMPPDPSLGARAEPLVATLQVRKTLHWYQWIVYTIVLVTCLIVSATMIEAWHVWIALQEAAQQFSNELKGIGG